MALPKSPLIIRPGTLCLGERVELLKEQNVGMMNPKHNTYGGTVLEGHVSAKRRS